MLWKLEVPAPEGRISWAGFMCCNLSAASLPAQLSWGSVGEPYSENHELGLYHHFECPQSVFCQPIAQTQH